jgi:hypothetical protein
MTIVRRVALLGILASSVVCGGASQSLPVSPPTVQPPPIPDVPPLTGGITYQFSGPLTYPVSDWTAKSKYVLYDGGAFALQSSGREFPGTYLQQNGQISFHFDAFGSGTTGTLNGDVLEVRYSLFMFFSDFEDAVYKRAEVPLTGGNLALSVLGGGFR